MKNFTPELIAEAKTTKSAEELLALCKAHEVELTEAEAQTYFAQFVASGAMSDDELEAVSGGFNCGSGSENDSEADTTDSNLDTNIGNKENNSKFV